MTCIVFEIKRMAWSNIKHIEMTSFLVGRGGGGGFLRTNVSQGNDVCPWISRATLYPGGNLIKILSKILLSKSCLSRFLLTF